MQLVAVAAMRAKLYQLDYLDHFLVFYVVVSDTIVLYDTVVLYDTIVLYDTVVLHDTVMAHAHVPAEATENRKFIFVSLVRRFFLIFVRFEDEDGKIF